MKKRTIFNIVLLSLTFVIGITVVFPGISDIIENSKENSFNLIKADIFKSAENKYNKDDEGTEYKIYKVSDLIKEGYITKDSIKEGYNEDSKVLITNEDGKTNYYYINGDTLLNIIKNKKDDNIINYDGSYLYIGENPDNYISFNQEIYRIVMIDSNGYSYIIKDSCDESVKKENINDYLISQYNDKYSNKDLIENELSIMDYELYNKTKQNNKTYINSSKDMWIKKENNYMILTSDTSEIIDSSNSACIKTYLKLKNISFVEKGVGTQFNPYIIDVQNY